MRSCGSGGGGSGGVVSPRSSQLCRRSVDVCDTAAVSLREFSREAAAEAAAFGFHPKNYTSACNILELFF